VQQSTSKGLGLIYYIDRVHHVPKHQVLLQFVLWTVLFPRSWISDLVNFVVVVVVGVVHMQKNLQFQFCLVYIIAVMTKRLPLRSG
jgi:hypothetical protein